MHGDLQDFFCFVHRDAGKLLVHTPGCIFLHSRLPTATGSQQGLAVQVYTQHSHLTIVGTSFLGPADYKPQHDFVQLVCWQGIIF